MRSRPAGRVGAHGLRYAAPTAEAVGEPTAEAVEPPGDGFLAGRALGPRELKFIAAGVVVLVLVLAGLAVGGVFSGSKKHPASPPTTASTPTTTANRVTTTAPSKATSPPVLPVPTAKLQAGSQGTQVKQLQRALAHLGYAPGTVDGDFGPVTEAAVMRFQTAAKLDADGVVGPLTLAALGKALRSNSG